MRTLFIIMMLGVSGLFIPSSGLAQAPEKTAKPEGGSTTPPPGISGVWMGRTLTFTFDPDNPKFDKKDETPLSPPAEAQFKALRERNRVNQAATDPTLSCFPAGMPRILLFHFPMEVIQIPGRVVMLFEFHHLIRQVYTDGREHPKDPDPTYMGHSIGHWEGDTLVVDTIGLNYKTWLDQVGHPHSDALHLVERIRRIDKDTLEDALTFDDPKTFTKVWSGRQTFKLHPHWNITEYVCEDTINRRSNTEGQN